MIYVTANPCTTYFYWQLRVQGANFRRWGIAPHERHVLVALFDGEPPSTQMRSLEDEALVFFYPLPRPEYQAAVKPALMAAHYAAHPWLEREYVFYLDSDVIFSRLPDFSLMPQNGDWYVSPANRCDSPADTNYMDSTYLKKRSPKAMEEMCQVAGIAPEEVERRDAEAGGVQYLLTGVDSAFWKEVEAASIGMVTNYNSRLAYYKELGMTDEISIWCAEMFATLWKAWLAGKRTVVHPELGFSWPVCNKEFFIRQPMFHMTGVHQDADGKQHYHNGPHFFKAGKYVGAVPFYDDFSWLGKDSITQYYVRYFKDIKEPDHLKG